jgi:hypothetical protein
LNYKHTIKKGNFCDSLEPNKHWSKQLRFGEEFPAENPTIGVLPIEHQSLFMKFPHIRLARRQRNQSLIAGGGRH